MEGRVDLQTFYISSAVAFAVAIVLATVRTFLRFRRFRKLFPDDIFLFIGIATLAAGTVILWLDVPYAYVEEQVALAALEAPGDFAYVLRTDVRLQFAATILVQTTIVLVKLSFLFFFRRILERAKRLYILWWWVVLVFVTVTAPVIIFSDVIACPYVGNDVQSHCLSSEGRARENGIVKASSNLDEVSDGLIVSIPLLILWSLRLSGRKKFGVAGFLCLSILMIVSATTRVSGRNLDGDKIDVLWVLLWLELEACIAVITVSLTAFRMLFSNSGTDRGYKDGNQPAAGGNMNGNVRPGLAAAEASGTTTAASQTRRFFEKAKQFSLSNTLSSMRSLSSPPSSSAAMSTASTLWVPQGQLQQQIMAPPATTVIETRVHTRRSAGSGYHSRTGSSTRGHSLVFTQDVSFITEGGAVFGGAGASPVAGHVSVMDVDRGSCDQYQRKQPTKTTVIGRALPSSDSFV